MATQRVVRMSSAEVRLRRNQAASMVEVIAALGSRQLEFRTALGERLAQLSERASSSETYHARLEQRLEHITQRVKAPRTARNADRIALLAQQLELLRAKTNGKHSGAVHTRINGAALPPHPLVAPRLNPDPPTNSATSDRLASALIYAGALLLLWLILWQLGLAVGLG